MSQHNPFSLSRWLGIVSKEFIQLKRDKFTFGMIIGMPLLQLVMFGYAINTDPKHMPTVLIMGDSGPFARDYIAAMKNSDYFDIKGTATEKQAQYLIGSGDIQFAVQFPSNFERELVRGNRPSILVEADATDPVAAAGALSVLNHFDKSLFAADLPGMQKPAENFVDLRVHRRYNPEGESAYNIVPGLLGVILTMTMILMTALAMTRERERGTFENLLATPATPLEVMTGKIIPYILIGLIQVAIVLGMADLLFHVPMNGNFVILYAVILLFICANLTLGISFSSIASNQLQAMQMTFFYFLPTMLLSGFMFPFRGMPAWAQFLGNLLPLTHFLQLVRGILLKGNGFELLWPHIWPIIVFTCAMLLVGLKSFRRTLD